MTEELRTIDPETNEPYETRFKDASSARTFYQHLRWMDQEDSKQRAQVRNQIDGGQPFDPAKLKRLAQSWRGNHNFKTAKADLEKIEIPYWRLVDSAPKVASLEVLHDDSNVTLYRDVMEEEFDRTVKGWKKYFYSILTMNHEHCLFGFSGAFFDDDLDWDWEPVGRHEVLVEREAPADLQDVQVMCVRRKMTPTMLWNLVKTTDTQAKATETGWKVETVKQLLSSITKGENMDQGYADFEQVQARIRNNDLYLYTTGYIKVVNIYVREFDDTITKYIIADEAYANQPDIDTAEDYLFEEKNFAEDMTEVLGTLFFGIGTGDWYSVKGFGQDNFNHAMVENRSMNRILDAFTLTAALGLTDNREQGVADVPIKYLGPVFVIPNGLDQYEFRPPLAEIVGVRQLFRDNSLENAGVYESSSRRVAEAETATQGEIIAALDSSINQAQASLYLSQLGANILTEMFRRIRSKKQHSNTRAGKAAKLFQERCIERGVPEEILHDALVIVAAGGDSTMANPARRLQAIERGLAVSTNQNVEERPLYVDYLSALFGLTTAKRYISQNVDQTLTDGASYATLENVAFENGKEVNVLPEQDHEEHLPIHLKDAALVVDSYDAMGEITPQGHAFLSMVVPHMQVHLALLQRQPNKQHLATAFAPLVQQAAGKLEGINANKQREEIAEFQRQQQEQQQIQA